MEQEFVNHMKRKINKKQFTVVPDSLRENLRGRGKTASVIHTSGIILINYQKSPKNESQRNRGEVWGRIGNRCWTN